MTVTHRVPVVVPSSRTTIAVNVGDVVALSVVSIRV